MRQQIGTVQITRTRVYPLDPQVQGHPAIVPTEVLVTPGTYPVYRDGLSHYWRMTGIVNHQAYRMGDGMFGMNSGDVASDDDVVFYSRRYGPDEWADLLDAFAGEAAPALVFTITDSAAAPGISPEGGN